ncbi:hypothetical protein BpHYR1_033654 [Brachionus plicatilis]|uniref:Uncharacterized protein n=1 Tax=Brachionus plicatilis TaxID=10195 RepID=A0A3M7PYX8_BRAPC|nr:hypothetical protein BpHYR1_033654 [Brachionus plicatilis]
MVINNIKERAVRTIGKPRRINECLLISSGPYLTNSKNLTLMIIRPGRQANGFVGDPKQSEADCIRILGTQENLELFSRESIWYVDGTFDVSP